MSKSRFIQCTIGIAMLLGGCGSPPDDAPVAESPAVDATQDTKATEAHADMNPVDASVVETPQSEGNTPVLNHGKQALPTPTDRISVEESEKAPIAKALEVAREPAPLVIHAEPSFSDGVVSRETELKVAPRVDASNIQLLPAATTLRIVERQGGWYRVRAAGAEGWVRLLHISRRQEQSSSSATRELDALAGIATGRSGTGNVASTTGIRGFNEQDLSLAKPDFGRLDDLDVFAASRDQAAAEAGRRGLTARRIKTLAPVASSESATDALNRLRTKVNDVIPKEISSLFPSDVNEITAGREVAATILAVAPAVNDAGLQRYVNLIGRWIASQSERPDLPWHFAVIDSPDMNAFAVPGGYVLVTRGLYDSLSEPSELAGVLAHEIAHVVARHHIKAAVSSKAIAEGSRRALEILVPGKETLVGNLLGAGASLMTRKLDQHSEFEADRIAVVLASRAGFDPFGLPAVLARFETVSRDDDRISMLFRTHPGPKDRLQQLDAAVSDRLTEFGLPGAGGALYDYRYTAEK